MRLRSGITYPIVPQYQFPGFAPEVQDLIWHKLAQIPRIIELCRVDARNDVPGHVAPADEQDDSYKGRYPKFIVRRRAAPIFGICRRATEIALRYHYTEVNIGDKVLLSNVRQDIFYLGPAAMRYNDATYFGDIETQDTHAVFKGYPTLINIQFTKFWDLTRIAISSTFWEGLNKNGRLAFLYSFPDLEEMTLIVGDEYTVEMFDPSDAWASNLTTEASKRLVYRDGDKHRRPKRLIGGEMEFETIDKKMTKKTCGTGRVVKVPVAALPGLDYDSDDLEEVTIPEFSYMKVLRDGRYWGDKSQLEE